MQIQEQCDPWTSWGLSDACSFTSHDGLCFSVESCVFLTPILGYVQDSYIYDHVCLAGH